MNIVTKIKVIEYTPKQLEERRKQKQEMIDAAYKIKANEVMKAAEMNHIPGEPIKMGGPGSRIEDWEITAFDKANIDKEFPELIKESPWYYKGIYKNDIFHPELDLYLYGDEDRFVYSEEEWNKVKKYLTKVFYNQDDIKEAKRMLRKEEAYTNNDEKVIFYDDLLKNLHKNLSYDSSKKSNITRNWSYTITEGEHAGETLWSGRYCAVTGIVYCKVNFPHFKDNDVCDVYVLIEKRGKNTPDFQGKWCLPCGFLEANESGVEGVSRETFEETGIKINEEKFKLIGVQTNPFKSNKGHVTLRYAAEVDYMMTPNYCNINGEVNEVEDTRWVNVNQIDKYDWAFGHDELIKDFFSSQDYKIRDFIKKENVNLFD